MALLFFTFLLLMLAQVADWSAPKRRPPFYPGWSAGMTGPEAAEHIHDHYDEFCAYYKSRNGDAF